MTPRRAIALSVCVLGFLSACQETVWDLPVYQTSIRRITITPDTAVNGDTVRIEAVVADSTDERFRYSWWLAGEGEILPLDDHPDQSVVQLVVPRNLGCSPYVRWVSGIVTADNRVPGEEPATSHFTAYVRSPPDAQTTLDTILVTPARPAPGDTVRFEAIIEDPTDGFRFTWLVSHRQSAADLVPVNGRLDGSVVRMVVNPPNPQAQDPEYIGARVIIDNGSLDAAALCPWFSFRRDLSTQ